ncbi:hypothetical protein RB195_008962 [Necator americanus]|uniref:Uncharacterized protein n=1 Tax=Necator americanus TaxID=51031 RepID=A0ABR1CSB5_NECAM
MVSAAVNGGNDGNEPPDVCDGVRGGFKPAGPVTGSVVVVFGDRWMEVAVRAQGQPARVDGGMRACGCGVAIDRKRAHLPTETFRKQRSSHFALLSVEAAPLLSGSLTLPTVTADVQNHPTTCGLPGPGFKGNKLRAKARKYVGNDVKRIVKRDIGNYYSADYNPTTGDETEEDENDPMRTKIMGGERAVKDELPWAAAVKTLKKKSKREPAANFECFQM